MRRFAVLPLTIISLALLAGCNQHGFSLSNPAEEKPLTLETPKGYSKPVPIASTEMSWQKKALLAMVAPSIAEQIEKNHDGLKAPANQKPVVAAKVTKRMVRVARHSHKNGRRVASSKHKKASKALAAARSVHRSHALVAAKF